MFLECEVLQRYWNQNSKYALASGKVKYFIFLLLFLWFFFFFKRDKVPEREMKGVSFNASFLKVKCSWGEEAQQKKEQGRKQKHEGVKQLPWKLWRKKTPTNRNQGSLTEFFVLPFRMSVFRGCLGMLSLPTTVLHAPGNEAELPLLRVSEGCHRVIPSRAVIPDP